MKIKFNDQLYLWTKVVGVVLLSADGKLVNSKWEVTLEINMTGNPGVKTPNSYLYIIPVERILIDSSTITNNLNFDYKKNEIFPIKWKAKIREILLFNKEFRDEICSAIQNFIDSIFLRSLV